MPLVLKGAAAPAETPQPSARRAYACRCGRPIFFRNSHCLACNAPLGYDPDSGDLRALEPASIEHHWTLTGDASDRTFRRCANLTTSSGCNWLLPEIESEQQFCKSCRLDRTIPDLSLPGNAESYRRFSIAKRRLISLLIALRLPVASKLGEDPDRGLAFDFLRNQLGGPPVMTGHSGGIITINVDEADDATRERIREQMGEPYRTLLGHLRHESGHYYWDRLVDGTAWIEEFRALFGDERQDYDAALQRHYNQGPAPYWQQSFVSAYATSHPWEDWAETWAHYLHIMDTCDTALSFGLDPQAAIEMEVEPFGEDTLSDPKDPEAGSFLHFINSWTRLSAVLNELSRGMGLADFYPFVLSRPVVAKLHLMNRIIAGVEKQA